MLINMSHNCFLRLRGRARRPCCSRVLRGLPGVLAHFAHFSTDFPIYTHIEKFVFEVRKLRTSGFLLFVLTDLHPPQERLTHRHLPTLLSVQALRNSVGLCRD
jgi:hypothetical protein